MAINFPNSPTDGQTATLAGVVYTYNSSKLQWQSTITTTSVASGGTGLTTLTANNVILGAGTSPVTFVAPGTNGNVLTSNGTNWTSAVATGGVTSVIAGTGITVSSATGAVTISSVSPSTNLQVNSLGVGTAGSTVAGEIRATGAITAMYSDSRLKTNIQPIQNALDKVDLLTGMTFTQNEFAETFGYKDYTRQVGVFAQDVQQVQPEAVKPAPFDIDENNESKTGENYLTVQYEKLVPLLIEAIKELRAEVKALKGI